jgi:hypothetical protein
MQDSLKRLTKELAKVEEAKLKAFADQGRVILMIQDAPEELRRLADALEKVNIGEIQALIAYKLPEEIAARAASPRKKAPRAATKSPAKDGKKGGGA